MQEAMSRRALQQDAYRRGGEARQAHGQARRVLQGVELLVLSADYAHLLLFKELLRSWERTDLHERAGLRMVAFRQGYEGACADARPGALEDGRSCRAAPPSEEAREESACPISKRLTVPLLALV